jgi:hypothetical protein
VVKNVPLFVPLFVPLVNMGGLLAIGVNLCWSLKGLFGPRSLFRGSSLQMKWM